MGKRKVGPEEIKEMRRMYKDTFCSIRTLSEKFGLSQSRVSFYIESDGIQVSSTDEGHYKLPKVVELKPPVEMIEGQAYVISPKSGHEKGKMKEWNPVMVLAREKADRFLFRSINGNWREEFTLPQINDCKVEFA